MEGWRQRRLGSKEGHSTSKGNYKTDLTLTGLLMEGLTTLWKKEKRAQFSLGQRETSFRVMDSHSTVFS